MTRIASTEVPPALSNPVPYFYPQNSSDDPGKESWAYSANLLDRVVNRHQMTEHGDIAFTIGGKKAKEATFHVESFCPAIISSDFESILGDLPSGEEWSITATQ